MHAKLLQLCPTLRHYGLPCPRDSRQEYWSGLPGPPPGGLLDPGIEPVSPMSTCTGRVFFTTSAIWEAQLLNAGGSIQPLDIISLS